MGGVELPNVSHTVDANKVYYNPYVPQQANEIWYKTYGGHALNPANPMAILDSNYNKLNIVSNIYEQGLGKIVMDGEIYRIDEKFFTGNEQLTEINLPNKLHSINTNAFKGCNGLTTIIIPDSVYDICGDAFGDCQYIQNATIGNGVTYIKDGAFSGNTRLKNVVIGNEIKEIKSKAFYSPSIYNCIFTILATTPPIIYNDTFYESPKAIYVPSESIDKYNAANVWSKYSYKIKAIPSE